MALTSAQQRDLERVLDEEHRRLSRGPPGSADQSHVARQMRALEAARRRLADGTFGRCTACGRDIELDRLIAHPTAVRCLSCQQRHERLHPGGDETDS